MKLSCPYLGPTP